MAKKKFYVVITNDAGDAGVHRMRPWFRSNPDKLPPGFDLNDKTTHQLRNALLRHGWTVAEDDDEVRLVSPSGTVRPRSDDASLGPERQKPPRDQVRERDSIRALVPQIRAALKENDQNLDIRDGHRLPYSREILTYSGEKAKQESGMRYETDLLVTEQVGDEWIPRVVIERPSSDR
jgi:hypothetical protein